MGMNTQSAPMLEPEALAELLRRTTDYWNRQCRWVAMDTTYQALAEQWNALPEATETCHERTHHPKNNPR